MDLKILAIKNSRQLESISKKLDAIAENLGIKFGPECEPENPAAAVARNLAEAKRRQEEALTPATTEAVKTAVRSLADNPKKGS